MKTVKAKLKDLQKFKNAYEKLLKKHPYVMVGVNVQEQLVAYDVTLDWANRVYLNNIAPSDSKQ
jgi:hypothetical protein